MLKTTKCLFGNNTPKWTKWIELDQMDQVEPNGLNWTEVDWIHPSGPNRLNWTQRTEWIGPKRPK